jgi:hypothetical protein
MPTFMILQGSNLVSASKYTSWTCPTAFDDFKPLALKPSLVESFNAFAFGTVYEFDDSDNHVDFIPPGPGTDVLSQSNFADVLWDQPTWDGSVMSYTGHNDMMQVEFQLDLEESSGRQSKYPAMTYPDLSNIITMIVANYSYVNTNWIGKLAIETYNPINSVREVPSLFTNCDKFL